MNMKRTRGRGNYRQGGPNGGGGHGGGGGGGGFRPVHQAQQPMNRNHVFDSIGPDMRMRGTAQQLFEKYLQLGRDATGSGDRVMAEGYFQHAEHYFRIINAMNQAQQGQQGPQQPYQGGQQGQGRRYPSHQEAQQDGGPDGYASEDGQGAAQGGGQGGPVITQINGHGPQDGMPADDGVAPTDTRDAIQ